MSERDDHRSPASKDFIRLLLANERRIYAFILSMLPDLTDAEDVLQETSLVLWEKFDQYEPDTQFVSWACRIAHYKVLKHYEKKRRSRLQFSAETLERIASDAVAMSDELDARHHALAECLQKLPEKDRDLLSRRYAGAATVKAIARQVGRSIHAVYKALPRIHDTLLRCVRSTLSRELAP